MVAKIIEGSFRCLRLLHEWWVALAVAPLVGVSAAELRKSLRELDGHRASDNPRSS